MSSQLAVAVVMVEFDGVLLNHPAVKNLSQSASFQPEEKIARSNPGTNI